MPFAFSKSYDNSYKQFANFTTEKITSTANALNIEIQCLTDLYDSMKLNLKGLSKKAFDEAVTGYAILKSRGQVSRSNILSIADFSKSSASRRLFVIDLRRAKLLFNTYVAHGQNSGQEFANDFSNVNESLMSSPGFYTTSGTYEGSNGFSLYLNGLEKGINDRAYDRNIVMHGADYVSEDFIRSKGYIGRSWGCPAVAQKMIRPIVEQIKGGSVLFIYTPKSDYQRRSRLINA